MEVVRRSPGIRPYSVARLIAPLGTDIGFGYRAIAGAMRSGRVLIVPIKGEAADAVQPLVGRCYLPDDFDSGVTDGR